MGGRGSGRWYRWDKQLYLDEAIALDVRKWARQGLLVPGNQFSWQWLYNEEPRHSIQISVNAGSVMLRYRHRAHADMDWQAVDEPVQLDWTDCTYGGRRVWFICPACSRRVAKLFCTTPHFVCRHCADRPYASRNEGRTDRLIRQTRKLRAKIGGPMDLTEQIGEWHRPKGMHRATFDRNARQVRQVEARLNIWSTLYFGATVIDPTPMPTPMLTRKPTMRNPRRRATPNRPDFEPPRSA